MSLNRCKGVARGAALASVCAMAFFAGAARADVVLDSQNREISASAVYMGGGTQSKSAPGFGPWADSVSVSTTKSSGSASLDSTITTTLMHALGITSSQTQVPSVIDPQITAAASARYRVAFTLTAPTDVSYQASFPTHFGNLNTLGWTHSAFVDLRNLTTATTISHIQTASGTTDPPVSLSMTLAPGQYEIEALYSHSGFGFRPSTPYQDFGSFDVTMNLVPGPGVVGLAGLAGVVGIGAGPMRRRSTLDQRIGQKMPRGNEKGRDTCPGLQGFSSP